MCSSGDSTAGSLEKSEATMANTLNSDYATTFAQQQGVLANVQAKMNYLTANPLGYTPQQLATQTTNINENTAVAAKQAMGAAAAFAASHGGADVGNGAAGQLAGQIASGAAQSKAQQLSQLSTANQAFKQQNFWNALSGLNQVGSEYGNAGGTAISGAGNASNASVNAGNLKLATQQAGWSNVGSVISGVGALASAGADIASA